MIVKYIYWQGKVSNNIYGKKIRCHLYLKQKSHIVDLYPYIAPAFGQFCVERYMENVVNLLLILG